MVQSICKRQSIPRLLTYFVTRKLTENEMCMEFRFAIKINERSYEIDTKLKLAKREFKTGLYIEEILK